MDDDSLLQPFRQMGGMPAPGTNMGGWYEWNPNYDHHHSITGLAPGHSFGQWNSALARLYVASKADGGSGRGELAEAATRRNALLAQAITPDFFAKTRFPAYTLDKLACGLMDAHRLLDDPHAFATLDKVTDAALPAMPGHAIDREVQWKMGADISWVWDECYTVPENQFLLSAMGAGPRYRNLAEAYLLNATYFEPLSRGENVLGDNHAYSYINALCSAMQAYLVGGSGMHLRAAVNGFAMLGQQSYATGGWGPEELLRKPGYGELGKSLTSTHNHFETPCGAYAHMKLTRYLLRATRDGQYGDSMERVMFNTVLGVLPLQPDGRSFYHSDYNDTAKKTYSNIIWPCCSGTLPQVVADYGINSYFREPGRIWVNLYQPSALRWREAGTAVTLEQSGNYLDQRPRLHQDQVRSRRPKVWEAGSFASLPGQRHPCTHRQRKSRPPSATKQRLCLASRRMWHDRRQHAELTAPHEAAAGELACERDWKRHRKRRPQPMADTVALMYGPSGALSPSASTGEAGRTGCFERDALLAAERTAARVSGC